MPRFIPIIITVKGDREGEAAVEKITNAFKQLDNQAEQAGSRGVRSMASEMRNAVFSANILTDILYRGLGLLKSWIVDSTLFAGRTQELTIALHHMAQVNGISFQQIEQERDSLIKLNISRQEATQILSQMLGATGQIARATELARVAQDAAVITGRNSSEAFIDLYNAILLGNTAAFRAAGVYLSVEEALDKGAKALKLNRDALSEQQHIQILTNAAIEYGTKVAGTYEAAMGSTSKQMRSMDRLMDDAKESVGELFQGAFAAAIEIGSDFLKMVKNQSGGLQNLKLDIDSLARTLIDNKESWREWGSFAFEQIGHVVKGIEMVEHSLEGLKVILDKIRDIASSSWVQDLLAISRVFSPFQQISEYLMQPPQTQPYSPAGQQVLPDWRKPRTFTPGIGPRLSTPAEQNIFTQVAPALNNLTKASDKATTSTNKAADAAQRRGRIDEENIREARLYFNELGAAFAQQFGRAMPARWGGSALHARQGMDHRAAGDIGVSPGSPEGRWIINWLKENNIPFSAWMGRQVSATGRVLSSGPHIHFGAPSGKRFGPQGLSGRDLDEALAATQGRFYGKSPQEIMAMMQADRARAPVQTKEPEIIESLGRQWDLYYDRISEREAEIAERRKFFADEHYANQKNLAMDLEEVELDLAHFRAQNADDQFVEQRRLLSAKGEELDLLRNIADVQDELANGPYNESLRIQLALLENIADIRRRDEEAIKAQNRAQLELADGAIVHGQRVRAAVLEHLASQRTMTEAWSDGIISAYDRVLGLLDRGIEKLTRGIPIVTQLVSALVHQLMNRVFQRFLDMFFPPAGGAAAPGLGAQGPGGGGGIFGSIRSVVGGLFGGGGRGVTGTPPFAGSFGFAGAGSQGTGAGMGALASLFGLGGGGMTAPTSLSSQVANQASLSAAIHEAGHAGVGSTAAAGGFSLAGMGASLGAMAPLLGITLGASLGGQSRFGQVLGGIGGGIAGLGIAALLGSSGAAGAFSSIGTLGGLLGFSLPLLPIAGALIIGAIILARNAARRRAETQREQLSQDTIGQLNALLAQARDMTLPQAQAAFEQIRVQYFNGVNQIKDSKTRRIATDWWYKPEHPPQVTWAKIKDAVAAGERAREIEKHLVPEFAHGGVVPYRTSLFSMTTGMTPIKVRPGEAMFEPGASFGSIVPGVDRGYDSVLTAARPGTRVVPRAQVGGARGFQSGGVVGSDGGATVVIEELNLELRVGKDTASEIVVTGVKTRAGGNAVVQRVNTFLNEGN